jgi:uncharacterized membrane protein
MGALALFAVEVRNRWRRASNTIASIARVWTGMVLVFYGVEHLLYPRLSPGVPDSRATSTWVPFPLAIAYLTGILLIGFGGAMLWRKYSGPAAALAGLLMAVLTVALYVPEYFLARTVPQYVEALNFVFDTLLFSGMLLVVAEAILATRSARIAVSQTAP